MVSGGSSAQNDPQQQILDRAAGDPEFRARLLANPNAAIQEQLGVPLPSTVTIRVIEEQPGEVVLVLPAQGITSGTHLSDTELEAVSGGDSGGGFVCTWAQVGNYCLS